jgi:hypothetical protein
MRVTLGLPKQIDLMKVKSGLVALRIAFFFKKRFGKSNPESFFIQA